MATLSVIIGVTIIGMIVVQLGLGVYGSFQAVLRERRLGELSQHLWFERISVANAIRAQQQLAKSAWNGHRKFVVSRKVVEADAVCSFYLVPHDGKPLPRFKPGQYLTFRLDIPGQPKPVMRCYSLSDAPNSDHYRVTIKRVPPPKDRPDLLPGLGSNHFHDHIHEGSFLDVKAPGGHFVLDAGDTQPAVLVGGGVGITPLLSMINSVAKSDVGREIWLFYGARNGREQVMRDHLRDLAREHNNLRVITCFSMPRPDEILGRDYDETGHLSVDLLRKYLPTNNYKFYVCGPPPMMKFLLPQLQEWGVPKADIFTEAFGPASVKARVKPPPAPERAKKSASPPQITFANTGKKLTWDDRFSNLLEFAAENGVLIESACCAGGCGTCQVAIRSGEVHYDEEPECEVEAGCCLTCVGRPKNDLVLDA